jgi:hypothetical protein
MTGERKSASNRTFVNNIVGSGSHARIIGHVMTA